MRVFQIFLIIGAGLVLASCGDKVEKDPKLKQEQQPSKQEKSLQEKGPGQAKSVVQPKKQSLKHVRGYQIEPDDMVFGNKNASVIFVEYFSPTCPHCVSYKKRSFPEIKKKYIDTQKIAYVMREFVSNKQDLDAAILARCEGSVDSYNKFISVLLGQQNSWMFKKNYRDILTNMAGLGGVSPDKYTDCLNSSALMTTIVENTKLLSREPKFIGTPSFFINGKQFNDPYTVEGLSNAIEKALSDGS